MLKMKFWHTGAAQAFTLLCATIAVYLVVTGVVSPWFLLAWFVCHQALTGFGAIGAHSLFCHSSYKTTPFWERLLALGGTLLCIGSPIQWAAGHTAHHDFADTPQDPHNAGDWKGLFLGRYVKPQRYSFRFSRHLVADKFHRSLHEMALLVPFGFAVALVVLGLIVSPTYWYTPVLFFYLAPLFTALTAGAIHNVVAHDANGPKDMPWFFPFMPWEWSHRSHHENPSNPNKAYKYKWLPDPSYWVIKQIRI